VAHLRQPVGETAQPCDLLLALVFQRDRDALLRDRIGDGGGGGRFLCNGRRVEDPGESGGGADDAAEAWLLLDAGWRLLRLSLKQPPGRSRAGTLSHYIPLACGFGMR